MTVHRIVAAFALLLLLTPPGGAAAAAPAAISRDPVNLAGADEPHTPPALNRALAFRYRREGAPPPRTVLVLIPGLNSGPNTFDLWDSSSNRYYRQQVDTRYVTGFLCVPTEGGYEIQEVKKKEE